MPEVTPAEVEPFDGRTSLTVDMVRPGDVINGYRVANVTVQGGGTTIAIDTPDGFIIRNYDYNDHRVMVDTYGRASYDVIHGADGWVSYCEATK